MNFVYDKGKMLLIEDESSYETYIFLFIFLFHCVGNRYW